MLQVYTKRFSLFSPCGENSKNTWHSFTDNTAILEVFQNATEYTLQLSQSFYITKIEKKNISLKIM